MKKLIVLLFLFCFTSQVKSQSKVPQGIKASFSSIIVNDATISKDWYQKVLGFEVVSHVENKKRGFEIYNLKLDQLKIELIELSTSISPKNAVSGYNSKMRFQGIFKIGYSVDNFDAWIEHLKNENVELNGQVVKDPKSMKRMVIILDPDRNRIQLFEK